MIIAIKLDYVGIYVHMYAYNVMHYDSWMITYIAICVHKYAISLFILG